MKTREELVDAWDWMWDDPELHVAWFRDLIFETWQYFRQFKNDAKVPNGDLIIYRYVSSYWMTAEEYPSNCPHYMYECCCDFAEGLSWAIENNFQDPYNQEHLPLLLDGPDQFGEGMTADMSSYESYKKDFREHLIYFMEMDLEGDELDEDEEKNRIDNLDKKKVARLKITCEM